MKALRKAAKSVGSIGKGKKASNQSQSVSSPFSSVSTISSKKIKWKKPKLKLPGSSKSSKSSKRSSVHGVSIVEGLHVTPDGVCAADKKNVVETERRKANGVALMNVPKKSKKRKISVSSALGKVFGYKSPKPKEDKRAPTIRITQMSERKMEKLKLKEELGKIEIINSLDVERRRLNHSTALTDDRIREMLNRTESHIEILKKGFNSSMDKLSDHLNEIQDQRRVKALELAAEGDRIDDRLVLIHDDLKILLEWHFSGRNSELPETNVIRVVRQSYSQWTIQPIGERYVADCEKGHMSILSSRAEDSGISWGSIEHMEACIALTLNWLAIDAQATLYIRNAMISRKTSGCFSGTLTLPAGSAELAGALYQDHSPPLLQTQFTDEISYMEERLDVVFESFFQRATRLRVCRSLLTEDLIQRELQLLIENVLFQGSKVSKDNKWEWRLPKKTKSRRD